MSEGHDAQRELEQRALRNVRALVDKFSEPEMGLLSALFWMLVIGAAVLVVVVLLFLAHTTFLSPGRDKNPDVRNLTQSFDQAPTVPAAPKEPSPQARLVPAPPKVTQPRNVGDTSPRVAVPVEPFPTLPVVADASCEKGIYAALSRPPPVYPPSAQRTGQGGWVILDFDVDVEGIPANIRVVAASPKGVFETSTVDAVRKARYAENQLRKGCRVDFVFKVTLK
jgi:TonB family protein